MDKSQIVSIISASAVIIAAIIRGFFYFKTGRKNKPNIESNLGSTIANSHISKSTIITITTPQEENHQIKHASIIDDDVKICCLSDFETKHIMKDVPETAYKPYHDGSRIKPSSVIPVYSLNFNETQYPQSTLLSSVNVQYDWQYHADSNYDTADLKFELKYPASVNTKEKTVNFLKAYDSPLKTWQHESLTMPIENGVPPKNLNIYATSSGDFELMVKNMDIHTVFKKL